MLSLLFRRHFTEVTEKEEFTEEILGDLDLGEKNFTEVTEKKEFTEKIIGGIRPWRNTFHWHR